MFHLILSFFKKKPGFAKPGLVLTAISKSVMHHWKIQICEKSPAEYREVLGYSQMLSMASDQNVVCPLKCQTVGVKLDAL